MSQLKYYNESTQQWEPTIAGAEGPQGIQGEPGPGIASGGTAGQIIAKVDGTDYNTEWTSSIDGNIVSLQHKRNTHAGWISENPILEAGEVGFETDTGLSKTGDGTKTWSALSWDSIAHSKQYVKAGESISKGQAVYVSGSDGTDMIVSKASNASEATSSKTFGLMNGTTSSGSYNTVVTEGILGGLDTSAATAGDAVWLGTYGNLIYGLSNKPSAPAHLVFIGVVEAAHASAGRIYVKVQNGFELDELHDVSITSPAAGEIIARNSANTLWENQTLAEAGVSAVGHTHDDRYYTETETNNLLNAKANLSGASFTGDISATTIISNRINSVEEGGEIQLAKASDNTAAWKIDSYGSTSTPDLRIFDSSGSVRLRIDGSGRVTTPSNPAFYARGGAVYYTSTNMADVPFNNAEMNIGSHFNTSTYRFTAPVSGVYQINTSLFYIAGGGRMSIKVNGGSKYESQTIFDTEWSWSGTIYLSAGDYVTVGDWQSTAGAQVYMGHSSFSGYLVG